MRHGLGKLARPVILLPAGVLAMALLVGSSPRQPARPAQRHGRPSEPGTTQLDRRPRRVLLIRAARYQLGTAVSGAAVSADGRYLLIAGGLLGSLSSSGSVVRIDLVTGRSSAAGQLAMPVHDAASAVLHGRLLVFGGGTSSSYAAVQRSAPGTARVYGALPAPRSDLVAVTGGRTAYLVGGHSGTSYARTVLATSDGRHFRVLCSLPVPVRYPGATVAGGDLWIFGGLTSHGPVTDVQRVDLRTGRASLDGRLPRPVEAGVAFTLDGTVYLAGGLTTAGPHGHSGGRRSSLVTSSLVRRFDRTGRSFPVAGTLPAPVAHAAVAVNGGIAYLVGGLDGPRALRTITTLQLVSGAGPITRR